MPAQPSVTDDAARIIDRAVRRGRRRTLIKAFVAMTLIAAAYYAVAAGVYLIVVNL